MIKKNNFSLLSFFIIISLNSLPLKAIEIKELQELVEPCFFSYRLEECQTSLIRIEKLQNNAASRENYACQTRLLGLQTDLLLIMNNQKKKGSPLKMMKQVTRFC